MEAELMLRLKQNLKQEQALTIQEAIGGMKERGLSNIHLCPCCLPEGV